MNSHRQGAADQGAGDAVPAPLARDAVIGAHDQGDGQQHPVGMGEAGKDQRQRQPGRHRQRQADGIAQGRRTASANWRSNSAKPARSILAEQVQVQAGRQCRWARVASSSAHGQRRDIAVGQHQLVGGGGEGIDGGIVRRGRRAPPPPPPAAGALPRHGCGGAAWPWRVRSARVSRSTSSAIWWTKAFSRHIRSRCWRAAQRLRNRHRWTARSRTHPAARSACRCASAACGWLRRANRLSRAACSRSASAAWASIRARKAAGPCGIGIVQAPPWRADSRQRRASPRPAAGGAPRSSNSQATSTA